MKSFAYSAALMMITLGAGADTNKITVINNSNQKLLIRLHYLEGRYTFVKKGFMLGWIGPKKTLGASRLPLKGLKEVCIVYNEPDISRPRYPLLSKFLGVFSSTLYDRVGNFWGFDKYLTRPIVKNKPVNRYATVSSLTVEESPKSEAHIRIELEYQPEVEKTAKHKEILNFITS